MTCVLSRSEYLLLSYSRCECLACSFKEIYCEMTAEDEELQILTNVISDGWPETLAQAHEFDRQRKTNN